MHLSRMQRKSHAVLHNVVHCDRRAGVGIQFRDILQAAALVVGLSIDDFGTGYSSLSYLKRYPVHTLKMDKSFIDHIADDEEDATFARMVIGIASTLNLDLIAEGVESEEQLQFLKREGCRYIQGYYFSKPLAPDKALAYMQEHYAQEKVSV